jgi:hypothetical protein
MALLNDQLIGRFQHYTDMCKKAYCWKIGQLILLLKTLHVAKGDLLGFVTSAQPMALQTPLSNIASLFNDFMNSGRQSCVHILNLLHMGFTDAKGKASLIRWQDLFSMFISGLTTIHEDSPIGKSSWTLQSALKRN